MIKAMKYFKHPSTTKQSYLDAIDNKTFVSPEGREYKRTYRKEGRKVIYIICYSDQRMQIKESDYNKTPIDIMLKAMENEINKY